MIPSRHIRILGSLHYSSLIVREHLIFIPSLPYFAFFLVIVASFSP